MKNPIIYGISLYLLAIAYLLPAYAMDVSGFISSGIEGATTTSRSGNELNTMDWNNYLNLNLGAIAGVRGLSFHGYGRYNLGIGDDSDSFGDLYLGYIEYRSFQNITNLKLGRFDLITNRYMTLDGVSFTHVTPMNFGVSVFAGLPVYNEIADDDEFNTDAIAYGGRLFLSGVDSWQFNINFYNESGEDENGDNVVYRRTVGVGGSYYKNFGSIAAPESVLAQARVDHDMENSAIQRISARFAGQYHAYQLTVFFDQFDMQGGFPDEKAFIFMSQYAEFKQTRYGGTAAVDVSDWLNIYAGLTLTDIDEGENTGMITRFGADAMLPEDGLTAGFQYYYYGSDREKANGVYGYMDWQFARDFIWYLGAEYAWVTEGQRRVLQGGQAWPTRQDRMDGGVFSVENRLTAYLTESLLGSVMLQVGTGDHTGVDALRWGLQVKYVF